MMNTNTTEILQQLTGAIHKIITPEAIYLLGNRNARHTLQSIYHTPAAMQDPTPVHVYVLIVAPLDNIPMHEWLDKTEARCRRIIPVTLIIKETTVFEKLAQEGNPFVCRILSSAECLYRSVRFQTKKYSSVAERSEKKESILAKGYDMYRQFMAGAELFHIREHYRSAGFLLHQAAELGLHSILKSATGLDFRSDNIERLVAYTSLVHEALYDWITVNREKVLLHKLQQAYSRSRYDENYTITHTEFNELKALISQLDPYFLQSKPLQTPQDIRICHTRYNNSNRLLH
ncbi:MAG: HEPN domain-containing protein [Agriterribacter sp.]